MEGAGGEGRSKVTENGAQKFTINTCKLHTAIQPNYVSLLVQCNRVR